MIATGEVAAEENLIKIQRGDPLQKNSILIKIQMGEPFANKLIQKNESFLDQLFEINSDEEILIEVKNRKIFRFNIDKQLTKDLMQRIFSLKEKEFLFFFDKSKLFLAFVETINPNDIDNELKRTLMSQREQFLRISLRQNFINNFLNFIKQETDINVNENLIESTLSNLRRSS